MTLLVIIVLTVWSLLLNAPLEQPSNPTRTPNPSKAPWYFLGLQEMLVFFDPWYAGVVLPSFIIVGLMLIPYLDINPKGNGYYTLRERWFEILSFFIGFHILWVSFIIIGTFFRGPGWNWFWARQVWDPAPGRGADQRRSAVHVRVPRLPGICPVRIIPHQGLLTVVGYAVLYFWRGQWAN